MSSLNWFEIPVSDMDRAVGFYEGLLGVELTRMDFAGVPHAVFPSAGVGGALVLDPDNRPSATGSLIYLDAGAGLDASVARVPELGGEPLTPIVDLGEQGRMAVLLDTEGNRVAVHSAA
ncbi:MAG TPA: VOC family protein [Pseudolysinimonas sp.]|nr:VOC family protein [Pseudolysinimonas sp.]